MANTCQTDSSATRARSSSGSSSGSNSTERLLEGLFDERQSPSARIKDLVRDQGVVLPSSILAGTLDSLLDAQNLAPKFEEGEDVRADKVLCNNNTDYPFADWLTAQQSEDAASLDTFVSFASNVDSSNRAVDTFYGSTVFTVRGSPNQDRESSKFTREFELLGDMCPNVLIMEGRTTHWYGVPVLPRKVIDLAEVEHYILDRGNSGLRAGESVPEPIRAWLRVFGNISIDLPVHEDTCANADLWSALIRALTARTSDFYSKETWAKIKALSAWSKTASDPSFLLDEGRTSLHFDFEGLEYQVLTSMLGEFSPPFSYHGHYFLEGSTGRLRKALQGCSRVFTQDLAKACVVSFSAVLLSGVQSVSTKSQSRDHGENPNGLIWTENITITVRYSGLWFVPFKMAPNSVKLHIRRTNNQMLAELIREALDPRVTFVTHAPAFLPDMNDEVGSVYLDSPSISPNGELREPPVVWAEEGRYSALLSGLARTLSFDLLHLAQREPERVRLLNVEGYIRGQGNTSFSLRDAKDDEKWSTFTIVNGLNLSVSPRDNAADWYGAMLPEPENSSRAAQKPVKPGFRAPSAQLPRNGRSTQKHSRTRELAANAAVVGTSSQPTPSSKASSSAEEKKGDTNVSKAPEQEPGPKRGEKKKVTNPIGPSAVSGATTSSSNPQAPTSSSARQEASDDRQISVDRPTSMTRSGDSVVAVPRTYLQGPQFELGNWLCKEVQLLSRDVRRYWASRASDAFRTTDQRLAPLKDEWILSVGRYVVIPTRSDPAGKGRNWYVAEQPNIPCPEVFRKTSNGEISPDVVQKSGHLSVPAVKRAGGSGHAPPAFLMRGKKAADPSPFA